MKKAWSSNRGNIIRDADAQTVKRWMPSSGFAPEGNIVHTEAPRKKDIPPRTTLSQSEANALVDSFDVGFNGIEASPPPSSEPKPSPEIRSTPLSASEEAVVAAAALRLLPDELESMRLQAFKEGEAEGYKRGHLEGIEAGKILAEEGFEERFIEAMEPRLREAQAPFVEIVAALQEEVPKLDGVIAEQILDLAIILAQQMTCKAIEFRPEIIQTILNEAVRALPREARGWLQIHVHPEDAEHVRKAMSGYLNENEQRIIEDGEIQRGGCRLVSRMGELDATLEARWQTLLKNLGRDTSWIVSNGTTGNGAASNE